jgi:hypothetical protein
MRFHAKSLTPSLPSKKISISLQSAMVGLLAGATLCTQVASAATLAGVNLEDKTTIEGKPLVLNGIGMRKKAIFKVYVAGLYVDEKTQSPDKILASPSPKFIKMKFLRDVDAGKMRDAWSEGFKENCTKSCETYKAELEELNKQMKDMKEGQTLAFHFDQETLSVWINDQKQEPVIKKAGFPAEVLSIWLGKNPPSADLKKGLLGML